MLAINKNWGVLPSLVVQAAQLFQLSNAGLFYRFTCGPEFVVGYYCGNDGTIYPGLDLGLKAWLSFSAPVASVVNPDAVIVHLPIGMGLNVTALGALICLFLVRSAHRSRRGASLVSTAT